MVERRNCSFCGQEIEPGTGKMYIKKDGTVYNFCTNKCYKNMVQLGRVPRTTEWTKAFYKEKEAKLKTAETKKTRKATKRGGRIRRRVREESE